MGEKTLKQQNQVGLGLVLLANVLLFYGLSHAVWVLELNWSQVGQGWSNLLPIGFAAIAVAILNAQIDADTKARLVFMRWQHPLPGSQAFTKLGHSDPRVDMQALHQRLGDLPTEPNDQNRLWYRLYKETSSEPAVLDAHKEYLFARDYYVLAIGIVIAFGAASFWLIESTSIRVGYVLGLIAQVALTGQAARTNGRRLVCSVLALSVPLLGMSASNGGNSK